MITLTYGLKVPESTDGGAAIFTALEDDIERIDGHTHNGTDSAPLAAQAVLAVSQTISSGSWVANGATGHYRQAVTVPAGFVYDTTGITFRITGTTGAQVFPTVERISSSQYYVYTIDNTLSYTAVYS